MKKLFILRHGTVCNPEGIVYRRKPGFALSSAREREAESAATFLHPKPIQIIYHLPIERTQQTAQIVNRDRNIPLIVEPRLHEWDEFENSTQVCQRIQGFWQVWLRSKYSVRAAVSHRDPIRILLFILSREEIWSTLPDLSKFPLPPAGIYRLLQAEDRVWIDFVFAP